MNKDPDLHQQKVIHYTHMEKKHVQEMLREVREQMSHDVEAMLDNRVTTANNVPKDSK